jgi:hypothetical protein
LDTTTGGLYVTIMSPVVVVYTPAKRKEIFLLFTPLSFHLLVENHQESRFGLIYGTFSICFALGDMV